MAATVVIRSYHGTTSSPTITDITGIEVRHKRADNDAVDVLTPIPVPAAGTNYGWRKLTRIEVTGSLSPGGQVGNIRWYADVPPGNWAGTVSMFSGTTPSYLVVGTASDETAQLPSTANVNVYTTSVPLTVNSAANAITQNGFGTQDYVISQIGVLAGTPSGVKAARAIIYRYDEI